MILSTDFYHQSDVVQVARDLLGQILVTEFDGIRTAGVITETEAYSHRERGCHAFGRKRTARTESMFLPGGHAYVYLCYGIHHLFNVVTNTADEPEAVLIRAVRPVEGIDEILRRRGRDRITADLCNGPGKLTQALGIRTDHDRTDLTAGPVRIEHGEAITSVRATPRIGIEYAGADAGLPWRFVVG